MSDFHRSFDAVISLENVFRSLPFSLALFLPFESNEKNHTKPNATLRDKNAAL